MAGVGTGALGSRKLQWGGPSCEPAVAWGELDVHVVMWGCREDVMLASWGASPGWGSRQLNGQSVLWDLRDTPGGCWNPSIQLLPFVPCYIVNIPGKENTLAAISVSGFISLLPESRFVFFFFF